MQWSELLTIAFASSLASATVRLAAPLLLAAIGEVFAERSGILNVGVEGMMLIGALTGFLGSFLTRNPWGGLLAAMIGSGLIALLHGFLSITLHCDQVVSGIGINLLALGLTTFANRALFGIRTVPPSAVAFREISLPLLSDVPIIGPLLFSHHALVYLGLLVVPVSHFVLFRTMFGLNVSAVGEKPSGAEAAGVDVAKVRYVCVLIGGLLAGAAGAALSLAQLNLFKESMVAGRGYIAIAVVMFGRWRPVGALGAALLFGLADALQLRLQAMGLVVLPSQLLLSLPYLATILALVGRAGGAVTPSALAVPYTKE
jgi:simple sugar transport system permease protein